MSRPSAAALLKQRQRPPRNGEKEGGGARGADLRHLASDRRQRSFRISRSVVRDTSRLHGSARSPTHPDFAHPASSGGKLKKTGKSGKSSCWLETQVFPSSLGSRCDLVLDFGGALKLCGDHLANGPKS